MFLFFSLLSAFIFKTKTNALYKAAFGQYLENEKEKLLSKIKQQKIDQVQWKKRVRPLLGLLTGQSTGSPAGRQHEVEAGLMSSKKCSTN